MKVFLRAPFNYDVDEVSSDSGLLCRDESLTLQSQAEEADINVLVRRFGVTGSLPQAGRAPPSYQDFEGVFDYRSALDLLRSADDSFLSLDAAVRSRFDNDPALFVDFCTDPANIEEVRKMGLAPFKEVLDGKSGDSKVG